jgi:hypothetical protein
MLCLLEFEFLLLCLLDAYMNSPHYWFIFCCNQTLLDEIDLSPYGVAYICVPCCVLSLLVAQILSPTFMIVLVEIILLDLVELINEEPGHVGKRIRILGSVRVSPFVLDV